MPLVAGVDCSTQATKVLLVDVDEGQIAASGRASHDVTGTGGARETDPLVWWRALGEALGETGRAGEVVAIAIAGQQHGLVTLDGNGLPLRPAMLWNDTRAAGDAQRLIEELGGAERWASLVGVVPVASFTVAKWAWLRRTEPRVADRVAAVLLPHDYLTRRLTGTAVTDRGDASGTGWWSTRDEAYLAAVLELRQVRLDAALLPEVRGPAEPAGVVHSDAAAATGLPAGIPVGPGTGDNMGAALGLGLEPGVPVFSLGTSGTAYAVSTRRAADASGTVAGFADAAGRYLPLAATLNCTLAVDRFAAWLGLDRDAVPDQTGVVVLPYLDGERTPNLPAAAGSILGLRHGTEPGEILLAAYEGAVASLVAALDAVDVAGSGLDADAPIVLIGGGARGETWRRVVARLSGRSLLVPDADELVALGAAVQAAAILEDEDPLAVAGRWDTLAGQRVTAPARDEVALARIARAQQRTAELNRGRQLS